MDIKLPINNVMGILPGREVFQFKYLETLDLWNNDGIYGDITEISSCTSMKVLSLGHDDTIHLSGTIQYQLVLAS